MQKPTSHCRKRAYICPGGVTQSFVQIRPHAVGLRSYSPSEDVPGAHADKSPPKNIMSWWESPLYMIPKAHAKFRPNPCPLDHETAIHALRDVQARESRPRNKAFVSRHCSYVFPMGHAKFRPDPCPFDHEATVNASVNNPGSPFGPRESTGP